MEPRHDASPDEIGPYSIRGVLGSGGMGKVFLGMGPDGRLVAVKVIHESLAGDEQFRRRFGREVSAAQRIRSPRVAEVIAADPDAPRPWMATTYVDGKNLQEAMETRIDDEIEYEALPSHAVMSLAAGVGAALVQIHAAGVTHRDLKPTNILLSQDGPKVIDFGIARAVEMSTVTVLGEITGSAGFMSPEQMQGLHVGPPSDMFSLGSVLFFAATATYPFGVGPLPTALYRIVHEEPDLSAIVDGRLRAIIAGCLHKDPAQRLTAQDLLRLIEVVDAEDDEPVADLPRAAPGAEPRHLPTTAGLRPEELAPAAAAPARTGTRRVSAMIAAALVLLVGTGTFLAFRHHSIADASSLVDTSTHAPSSSTGGPASSAASTTGPTSTPGGRSASPSLTPSSTPSSARTPAKARPTSRPVTATTVPKSDGARSTAPPSTAPKTVTTKDHASTSLGIPGDPTAKAYFGRLDDVVSAASGISFDISTSYRRANRDLCVLTVVVRDVEGSEATVFANGLGAGWRGAETTPSSDPSVDDGAVHQQLIIPPTGTGAGKVWTGSGLLRVDGSDSFSDRYTLRHRSGGDQDGLWTFDGTPVSCAVY